MKRALSVFTGTLGKILPEGKFKELLRSHYYRSPFSRYVLNLEMLGQLVAGVEQFEDESLLMELNDGIKFYAPRDKVSDPSLSYAIKYGRKQKLSRIGELVRFWGLIAVLREIFVDRIYERYYQPKKGDVIVDVGAHIGIFSVRASQAVGNEGQVIAIEPDVRNLEFLKRNIEANKLTNVITVPKGVWSREDLAKLYLGRHSMTSSLYHEEWQSDEFIEVKVDKLDCILERLAIKKVDFIKMDVEGAEIEAMKGMQETLRRNNNIRLAISAYHKQDGRVTAKTIASSLRVDGFDVRDVDGIVYAARNSILTRPR